jgi:hypothetical protein
MRALHFVSRAGLALAVASSMGACGQAFTATSDGGRDGESRDVTGSMEAGEDAFPPEASAGDSNDGMEATDDAACPGPGSFDTDPKNCGGCGHVCGLGEPCNGGMCKITTIESGLTNPNGIAVDLVGQVFFSELGHCTAGICTGGQVLKHVGSTDMPLASALDSLADSLGFPGLPVACDGASVYWAVSASPGLVQAQSVAGTSSPLTITPPITASWVAMAVDDEYLYVGESGGSIYYTPTSTPGTWTSITNSKEKLAALVAARLGTKHYVFWANSTSAGLGTHSGSVRGAIATGSAIKSPLWTASGLKTPISVAISTQGVDWIEEGAAEVREEPVSMGSISTVAGPSAPLSPTRIVSDSTGTIYWTVRDMPANQGSVMRLTAGATTPIVLAKQQNNPGALTIDATTVYWVNAGTNDTKNGSIMSTWR